MSKKLKTQIMIMRIISEVLLEDETNDDVDLFKLVDSLMQSIQTQKRNRNGKNELLFGISDDNVRFQVIIRFDNKDEMIAHEIEIHRID